MKNTWTADTAWKMRRYGISGKALSQLTGYTPQYISNLLTGKRVSPEAQSRIDAVFEKIEKEAHDA